MRYIKGIIMAAAFLFSAGSAMAQTAGGGHELIELHYQTGDVKTFLRSDVRSLAFEYESKLEEGYYPDTIYFTASTERSWEYGDLYSSTPVTFDIDVDWASIKVMDDSTRSKYSLDDDETIWLIYTDINTSSEPRSGNVTVSNQEGDTLRFHLIQNGYNLYMGYLNPKYENPENCLKKDTIDGSWDYRYWWVYLNPNHNWKLESYPDWLTPDSSSLITYTGKDYEDFKKEPFSWIWGGTQVVYFQSRQNTTGQTLEGDIVFSGMYGQTVTMHVVQPSFSDETAMNLLDDIQAVMGSNRAYPNYSLPTDYGYQSARYAFDRMSGDIVTETASNYDWYAAASQLDCNPNYNISKIVWEAYYSIIRKANEIIDMMAEYGSLVSNTDFILGNAMAYRALALMELVQTFQNPFNEQGEIDTEKPGVPVILSAAEMAGMDSTTIEYLKGRNTVNETLTQVLNDLKEACKLLEGKRRPDKQYIDYAVANGLMARLYQMAGNTAMAAAYAAHALAEPLNHYGIGLTSGFNDIEQDDVIWGWKIDDPSDIGYNHLFSWLHNDTRTSTYASIIGIEFNSDIVGSVRYGDKRAGWSNDSTGYSALAIEGSDYANIPYMQWKFRADKSEGGWPYGDYIYMRTAEMELIIAEAALDGYLPERFTQEGIAKSMEQFFKEREFELIGEGHSLFDHKRTGRPVVRGANDPYMPGQTIQSTDYRLNLPIPTSAFTSGEFNLSESDQNPGYAE